MKENAMSEVVRRWIEKGEVDVFLGYRMTDGHPLPYAYSRRNLKALDEMVMGPARYPLEKLAAEILAENPEARIGIPARDCNRRALQVMLVHKQIQPGQVKLFHLNCCPSGLHDHSDCTLLSREPGGTFKGRYGIDKAMSVSEVDALPEAERFRRWMYEFQKCIKCFGCRNICPVCFCPECSLENSDLVELGPLPPEVPIFHLVRAVHMAGRCVDCGLCEDACPMELPLRLLYRKGNEIVKALFAYVPGTSSGLPPFGELSEPPQQEESAKHEAA